MNRKAPDPLTKRTAAFAKALKLGDDQKQLAAAVKDMYQSDELMTELAEGAVNLRAAA